MSYGDHVPESVWNTRQEWIRSIDEKQQHPLASYLLSSHGVFITYNLEIAFCAGAWVAVIVLAHAAIDATLRDVQSGDYSSNSKAVFGGDPDLEWLRKRRNWLVHVHEGYNPADFDTVEDFHATLEEDARRAMQLVYRTFYSDPGT